MKFNWRANWELLLVLLIISVVIVIATIAAIKNKDKALLALPDESEFGQFAIQPNGTSSNGHSAAANQQFEAADLAHSLEPSYHQKGGQRPAHVVRSEQQQQQRATTAVLGPPGGHQQQVVATNSRLLVPATLDDGDEFSKPPVATNYDDLSSEPNPSQIRSYGRSNGHLQHHNHHHLQHQGAWMPPGSAQSFSNDQQRRNTFAPVMGGRGNMSGGQDEIRDGAYSANNQFLQRPSLSNPLDLSVHDDIHTTRSSFATSSPTVADEASPHSRYHQQQQHLRGQVANNQSSSSSHEFTGEDLLHPFGRLQPISNMSSGANLDDANKLQWLNSALLANLMSTLPQTGGNLYDSNEQQQAQKLQPPSSSATGGHSRSLAGSLPISILFSDLLKLARPGSSSQQQQQQQQLQEASLAPNKPQQGILQQLRSLPSPLGSLLASLAPVVTKQQQGVSSHEQPSNGLPGHDASESNQHYQQIPLLPTDIHSILARSMWNSNVLPAFPPPKDTFERWIPPNAGGRADYHSSSNTNADFVSTNTAGFMRNGQLQGGQQSPSAPISDRPQQQQQQQQPQEEQQGQQMSSSLRNHVDPLASMYKPQAEQHQQQQPISEQLQPTELLDSGKLLDMQQELQPPTRPLYTPDSWASIGQQPIQQNSASKLQQNQLVQAVQQVHSFSYTPKQVPLGYQPTPSYQQQQLGQVFAQQLPKPQPQQLHKTQEFRGQTQLDQQQQQTAKLPLGLGPQSLINQQQQQQQKTLTRRKRSQVQRDDPTALSSPSTNDDDDDDSPPEEDDVDSPPLSVLSPDGRPVRLVDSQNVRGPSESKASRVRSEGHDKQQQVHKHQAQQRGANSGQLEAAGSGLMSKLLLGTESNNRGESFDDDLDDDDLDTANEKREDELEQAEFGILADKKPRRRGGSSSSGSNRSSKKKKKLLGGLNETLKPASMRKHSKKHHSNLLGGGNIGSSGTSDRQSYARRNQQRSDIEFYGHPGEETRQLKYGILGSGNYEVVNGGVYTDNDESAAAVNSIANYVRRPSALLPRLLGSEPVGAQAAFMPGARLGASLTGAGGFLRDSSNTAQLAEEQLLGLVGGGDGAGNSPKGLTTNPLMDFIYDNGASLIDTSMLNHLGSSGSSTRTVLANQDNTDDDDNNNNNNDYGQPETSRPRGKQATRSKRPPKTNQQQAKQRLKLNGQPGADIRVADDYELDSGSSGSENQSVLRGRPESTGANQFHSYHILPSKKVSIFSEKDLDSEPSEHTTTTSLTSAPTTKTTPPPPPPPPPPTTTTTTTSTSASATTRKQSLQVAR